MKKLFFFSLLFLICFLANGQSQNVKIDGIYYTFEGNNAVVTFQFDDPDGWMFGNDYSGDVVIPEKVEYNNKTYLVTAISDCAFASSKISSLYIGKNVVDFRGAWASNMNFLEKIDCHPDNSKVKIYKNVLYNKQGTQLLLCPRAYAGEVEILEGVSTFQLSYCNFSSIILPKTITKLVDGSFNQCKYFEELIIPENVTSISTRAFMKCASLAEITLNKNLKTIENNAFVECTKLGIIYNNSSLELTPGSNDYGNVALYVYSNDFIFENHTHFFEDLEYTKTTDGKKVYGELICWECQKYYSKWAEIQCQIIEEATNKKVGKGRYFANFDDELIPNWEEFFEIPIDENYQEPEPEPEPTPEPEPEPEPEPIPEPEPNPEADPEPNPNDGDITSLENILENKILIFAKENKIIVQNAENQNITIISLDGKIIKNQKAHSNYQEIFVKYTGLLIVKVGECTKKLFVR